MIPMMKQLPRRIAFLAPTVLPRNFEAPERVADRTG